ncbi:MAG: STM3941 family protein [Sneathiella sp.]
MEIRYSRYKNALFMLGGLSFIVGVFWILKVDPNNIWGSLVSGIKTHEKGWIFALGILFLTGCSVGYAWLIFDRRVQIRINEDGLYSRRSSKKTFPWRSISSFKKVNIRNPRSFGLFPFRLIAVYLLDSAKSTAPKPPSRLKKLFKYWTDGDVSIQATLMDHSQQDIMDALQTAHQKYASHPNYKFKG